MSDLQFVTLCIVVDDRVFVVVFANRILPGGHRPL